MELLVLAGAVVSVALVIGAARLAHRWVGAGLHTVLDVLRYSRISVAVLVFGALVLAVGGQGRAIAAGLADTPWKGIAFLAAAGFWALSSWYYARLTLDRIYGPIRGTTPFERKAVSAVPRLLGVLAFAPAILALSLTARTFVDYLYIGACAVLAAAFLALVTYRRNLQRYAGRRTGREYEDFEYALFGAMRFLSVAAIAVFTTWAFLSPVGMGFTLGPGTVAFIAFSSLVPVGTYLMLKTRRHHFPVILTMVAVAVLFSPVNDNHRVRTLEMPAQRLYPNYAFEQWLQQSPEKERQIVVIAAAGGGTRAAYWTSAVLGALQGAHPGFSGKLFAVSGVSGSSLGAAVFTALLEQAPQTGGHCAGNEADCYRTPGRNALSGNFLGPPLTAMLYPDLMQRLLPFAWLPDRAAALERGWEVGWRRALPDSAGGLERPFTRFWHAAGGAPDLWRPLLFLNGTHQESGRRIITSPMVIDNRIFPDALDYFDINPCEVRLSTAAHNSARLPYISPAGRMDGGGCDKQARHTGLADTHVVGGGYFENYGAATARDLLEWLSLKAGQYGVRLRPVVIQITNDASLAGNLPAYNKPPGVEAARLVNEPAAPVRAMQHAGDARGVMEFINLARWSWKHHAKNKLPGHPCFFHLRFYADGRQPGPPGWTLSDRDRQWVDDQMGRNREAYETIVRSLENGVCR